MAIAVAPQSEIYCSVIAHPQCSVLKTHERDARLCQCMVNLCQSAGLCVKATVAIAMDLW